MAPPKITALDAFDETFNWLVYGDPGSGKTVLGGTAPKALIVAVDPGTESTRRAGSTAKVTRPKTWKEFEELLTWLEAGNTAKYEWVIIDTLTELQNLMWSGILSGAKIISPRIQDYGTAQHLFKSTLKRINDLPVNVLYLAHAMSEENEDGDPLVLPDISGKNGTNDPTTMSRFVCGTVGLLGYLRVDMAGTKAEPDKKRPVRRLIVERFGPYVAKCRYSDVFGARISRPNIAAMAAAINAPVGAEGDSNAQS